MRETFWYKLGAFFGFVSMGLLMAGILLSAASCVKDAFAHPGRTDAQGGHYDHTTGEYHYHHGYPAHQHPNGVCPYDFDDRTGQSSGTGSGGTSTYDGFKAPPPPTPEPTLLSTPMLQITPEPTSSPTAAPFVVRMTIKITSDDFKRAFFCVFIIVSCFVVILICLRSKKEYIPPKIIIPKKKYCVPIINLSRFARVPNGYGIDNSGKPYNKNRSVGWGDEFNVYVTSRGKSYHSGACKSLMGRRRFLIHRYDAMIRYKACRRCRPRTDRAKWYFEDIKRRYVR